MDLCLYNNTNGYVIVILMDCTRTKKQRLEWIQNFVLLPHLDIWFVQLIDWIEIKIAISISNDRAQEKKYRSIQFCQSLEWDGWKSSNILFYNARIKLYFLGSLWLKAHVVASKCDLLLTNFGLYSFYFCLVS